MRYDYFSNQVIFSVFFITSIHRGVEVASSVKYTESNRIQKEESRQRPPRRRCDRP